ncbi:uncharacterized protein KY384_004864 [Bacidia gigantensis]|uniref:uncharacterized protein n=1 Tax=Bacidia gigantensis TaxID=2732470 RepID=UPI001D03F736|nr:uncharacterized protein KY384_004864 [Bacidia gigantensis]KAG8530362.1 hypothetical protein KY384_004864 [Bacidia gigantensis]
MAGPTAGWEKAGDSFYRKIKLYEAIFDPDLELENHLIAGAPYAGAIALHRDQGKLQTYRSKQSTKPCIDIYSSAGKLIRRINGAVEHGVKACRFWSEGFVAMLSNQHLIAVTHYLEPRPRRLAVPPTDTIHSWTIIPPAETLSRSVEVLLAVGSTIYAVDSEEAEDRALPNGPFKHIAVSPNGLYTTLYTEDGKVWIITSDFQTKLGEYDSKIKTVPNDLQWCGNDSVLLAWEDEVHLIGPDGSSLKYYYDDWVHMLPDVDGIRLITNEICEFLQKVPDTSEEVLNIGSTSAASVLLDAAQQLEKESPNADENIQLIRPNLPDAVATCVKAAGQQYDATWQKQLLKAASFGKSVLDLYSSDDFVEMCQTLRILNAVRDYKVGLPMTHYQYKLLTPEKLIQRLVNRREYRLALRLSNFLRLPTNKIFVHWASQSVRLSQADEEALCGKVVSRLASKRGISFETIARAAYDEGRSYLATKLLHHESRAGRQVPLLLSMSEDELALDKAIASGDTDLVYFVLLHLKKSLPLASFFRTLGSRPLATALVESSARLQDQSLLKDLYYQDDRRVDSANLLFSEALFQTAAQTKNDKLKLGSKLLADSSKDLISSQTLKIFQEASSLVRLQATLDNELASEDQTKYTGFSLNHTTYQLILHAQTKRAQKLSQDFHMPPKIYEWIRLRALVAARNFVELEDGAAKTKKSAIGWEAYFNEVFGAGNPKLAGGVFVAKCTGLTSKERCEMWMKCGMVQLAGEELVKVKDVDGLEDLRTRAGPGGSVELERMIARIKTRR